jgi:hypothetical protein
MFFSESAWSVSLPISACGKAVLLQRGVGQWLENEFQMNVKLI